MLSDTVEHLDVSNNEISKIENLPDSLVNICLDNNKIKVLENIPLSVVSISIHNNPINFVSKDIYKRVLAGTLTVEGVEALENLKS